MSRCPAAVTVLVALLLAALLTPAGALAESASPSPGSAVVTYKIGTTQEPDGFNPFANWSGVTWDSFRISYDFLTWYDENYDVTPDLATEWSVSDDGRVWTFTIREGMTWHDGVPLTAHDIAFTYNLILRTEHWSYIQYLTGVTKVEAPDDTTLIITCRDPNAAMLALYIPILPEHIWKDVPDSKMETFKNVPLIGSGPFQVTEVKKSDYVKLVPNPDYPEELGGPPKIDELMYVITQNMDSTVQDYKAGNLDAIVDWPASYYESLKGTAGGAAAAGPAIGFHELGFNCWDDPKSKGDPLLLDPVIRAAIHWSIDKQAIVDAAMGGLAAPADSLVAPIQGIWKWDPPEDVRYSYDPEKAMQLLEDAGYSDRDGDGVREDAKGNKLEFRYAVMNEYPEDQAAAKKIISWCDDVGIKLKLDQKDEGAFSDELYDDANYDLYMWSWGGDIDPGFMTSIFTTTQIFNWSDCQYSNPEYDKLFTDQAQAVDPADPTDTTRRKAIIDEMQAILYRDNPYIFLWYNVNLQAWNTDRWSGYHMVPPKGEGVPFWNMTRATYQDLEPVSAVQDESGTAAWIWVVVALVVVLAIVGFVWFRRRPRAVESA